MLSPSLFFLYLTLTQLSLSLSLSIFWKIVFEGEIKTKINLHPTHGQLKAISEKCIFHAQPNTHKYGKAFSEVIFTQNKHNLRFTLNEKSRLEEKKLSALFYDPILMNSVIKLASESIVLMESTTFDKELDNKK